MAICGGGGGGVNDLLLSQDLLALEYDSDDNASQRLASQNTLVKAATAFNRLISPSRVPPLTQIGSSGAEERREEYDVEDANVANMPPAKEELTGGTFILRD